MTTLTPNFSLPYPDALDAPCDFPEQWCGFTDAVQEVLDQFQSDADRTNPATLVAKMNLTTPTALIGNQLLVFDSVATNTAGMIDFDASRTTITISRPGRYATLTHVTLAATAVANNVFSLVVTTSLGVAFSENIDVSNTAVLGCTFYGINFVTVPPVTINVQVLPQAGPTTAYTVNNASLSVLRYGDN